MKINTVTGPVDSAELGVTLMHEHILIANYTMRHFVPDWFERAPFIDYAVRMIERAKAQGLKTIVDMTAFQLGRDASVLREVAERAEINIIACTGYYWYEDVCLIDKSPEYLAEIIINDIEKGMEGTGMKPGVIKACSDRFGVSSFNRRYLKAAAIASKATGLPISTHTNYHFGHLGLGQLDALEEDGVELGKVLIGHMGDSDDMEYVTAVADRAGFIGLDRFGLDTHYKSDFSSRQRAELAKKLIDAGYIDKLTFSHDVSCLIDNLDDRRGLGNTWQMTKQNDLEKHQFQFDFLFRNTLPALRGMGVTPEQIDTIMVKNPRRFFETTGK